MYGYVQVYRPDLRFREYDIYRSHYCGLCHTLQKRCNFISRLTLSYDFTFLSLLLDALYEPESTSCQRRCLHGIGKKEWVYNSSILDYIADLHLFFSYLHCLDDWQDNRKISHAALGTSAPKDILSHLYTISAKNEIHFTTYAAVKDIRVTKRNQSAVTSILLRTGIGGRILHL